MHRTLQLWMKPEAERLAEGGRAVEGEFFQARDTDGDGAVSEAGLDEGLLQFSLPRSRLYGESL